VAGSKNWNTGKRSDQSYGRHGGSPLPLVSTEEESSTCFVGDWVDGAERVVEKSCRREKTGTRSSRRGGPRAEGREPDARPANFLSQEARDSE